MPLRRVGARCLISKADNARMRLAQEFGWTQRGDSSGRGATVIATARRRLRPHRAVAKGRLRSANPLIQKAATASDRTDRKNWGSFYLSAPGGASGAWHFVLLPSSAGEVPRHTGRGHESQRTAGPMTHDPSVRCADTSPTSLGRRRMRDACAEGSCNRVWRCLFPCRKFPDLLFQDACLIFCFPCSNSLLCASGRDRARSPSPCNDGLFCVSIPPVRFEVRFFSAGPSRSEPPFLGCAAAARVR